MILDVSILKNTLDGCQLFCSKLVVNEFVPIDNDFIDSEGNHRIGRTVRVINAWWTLLPNDEMISEMKSASVDERKLMIMKKWIGAECQFAIGRRIREEICSIVYKKLKVPEEKREYLRIVNNYLMLSASLAPFKNNL